MNAALAPYCLLMCVFFLTAPISSPHVRQYLWECLSHHPAAVLRDGPLPHPDAESQGVHPLPPDPQPTQAEVGGVLPACLVLHQWHRHERCEYWSSHTQTLGGYTLSCVTTHSVSLRCMLMGRLESVVSARMLDTVREDKNAAYTHGTQAGLRASFATFMDSCQFVHMHEA